MKILDVNHTFIRKHLSGWVSLLGAGAVSALALPPLGLFPILFFTFPLLIDRWDRAATPWQRFTVAWWFLLSFYSLGFYWISHSLLIEPWKFGWLIPFGTLGLGGLIACFGAFAFLMAGFFHYKGVARLLVLASFWMASEWLRSFVLSGFPWNPLGSVWTHALPILQLGSLIGIDGLSFVSFMIFSAPILGQGQGQGLKQRILIYTVIALIPLMIYGWGSWRLAHHPTKFSEIKVRLVQPNIKEHLKWDPVAAKQNFAGLIALSQSQSLTGISAVIWPETASSFLLLNNRGQRMEAAAAAPPQGYLIAGTLRYERLTRQSQPLLWNSLAVFDPEGAVQAVYDKVHLVPFGEYMPLRSVLPLSKITPGNIDLTSGDRHMTISLRGLGHFVPLICYEAIFSTEIISTDQLRPEWILNITNDAWFGQSAGPYQHLEAVRMRAIEQGLAIVRVANSGISTVIDPMGREVASLALGTQGILDEMIPSPLDKVTLYGQWGERVCLVLGLFAIIIAFCLHARWRY